MFKMSDYKKVVSTATDTKGAKFGLGALAKNGRRTQVALGVLSLSTSTGLLIEALTPTLIGVPWSDAAATALATPMSIVGKDLVYLAKLFKLKLPTATKKVKLSGGRAENILAFNTSVANLSRLFTGIVLSPATHTVDKEIVLPSEGGKKGLRSVRVLDKENYAGQVEEAEGRMKDYLTAAIHSYWGLSLDFYGYPPAQLFEYSEAMLAPAQPAPVKQEAAEAKPAKGKAKGKVTKPAKAA